MKRTNIYLDEEQTTNLDKLAQQQGVSRAEVVRHLLNRALNSVDDNLAADIGAIGDSFGAFADLDVPTRGADGRAEHLGRMWHGTA